jgi:hypothetical protein
MSNNRVLLVLTGESFRNGPQFSRTRGTGDYINLQKKASTSHINLINTIKNKYTTDIFINTYALNNADDTLLLDFYKTNCNVIKSNFHKNLFRNEDEILNNTYDNIQTIIDNYDYILFIRIDLYLKKFFIENLTFDDKIMFAFIDSNNDLNDYNTFSICHMIILYPKKLFHVIKNKIIYNATHNIRNNLINNNVSINDIRYFINTLHICTTDLGWNPLYIVVGRIYNKEYNTQIDRHDTCDHYYDNINHIFVKDINKTIKYYEKYMMTEID